MQAKLRVVAIASPCRIRRLWQTWTTTFYYQNRPEWELGKSPARGITWAVAGSKVSVSKMTTRAKGPHLNR
jgi:hypothetical protein